MDSDGDGKSNGEELGDPNCQWVEGQEPERKTNITHPGICDPIGSKVCKEHNSTFCNYEFNCPNLANETGNNRAADCSFSNGYA